MRTLKPLHRKSEVGAIAEPETGLPGLIRFANLVPADVLLPAFPDVKCMLLGIDYSDDAVLEREFMRFLDENFPRERFGEFRQFLDSGVDNPYRTYEMYDFLTETRDALKMIATHQQARSIFSPRLQFPWAQVSKWKVDRIRMCENCQELFFANRKNKLTCSDSCSTARRVREWRTHQPQYEQARKLKSARTTKDNRTKPKNENAPSACKKGSQGGKIVPRKTR